MKSAEEILNDMLEQAKRDLPVMLAQLLDDFIDGVVESGVTIDELISYIAVLDKVRKRLDRMQANGEVK